MQIVMLIAMLILLGAFPSSADSQEVEMFGEDTEVKKLAELSGYDGQVNDAIEIHDGRLLTAGEDGTIRLWNVASGQTGRIVAREDEPIHKLQLYGDQLKFLAITKSGKIIVWQLPRPKRGWGPEQVTGSPDSGSGDQSTAWASATEDNAVEWLVLEYAEAITPVEVQVYENYNPGAVVKVTTFDESQKEITLWQAKEEARPAERHFGMFPVTVKATQATKRIKLYIDSPSVPGWNEIDAVGVVDDKGRLHWAVKAGASSTYADRAGRREFQR